MTIPITKTAVKQSVGYNSAHICASVYEVIILAANKARAYFGISGYHFDPSVVTSHLGLEPTSVNDAGMRGSLDKPVISTWEFSTKTITSDTQNIDVYKLIDNEILKIIEPAKDKIIEICKNLNVSPRIGVELTLSIDKNETTPDVGFGGRIIKFCAEIGAFINIDYKLSARV